MSDLDVTSRCTTPPQPLATLWHCSRCNALVSIQSAHVVSEAFCPACVDAPLEFLRTL